MRKQSFNVIKPRKETLDEFVNRYFKERVVKVWPDGWMKLEELHKEYEKRLVLLMATRLVSNNSGIFIVNRKINGTKKPKENKKPPDVTGVTEKFKQSSSVAIPSNVDVLPINNNNNVLTPSTGKIGVTKADMNDAVKKEAPVIDLDNVTDLSIKDSADSTSTPSFGSNLTITAINSYDKKPLPSVPNQVI